MPHIALVITPSREAAALAGGLAWTCGEVAEYAPERSFTARCVTDDGPTAAYVKHVPPDGRDLDALAARYDHVAHALQAVHGVRAPSSLGRSSALGLLVLEAMPGVRWARHLHDDPPRRRLTTAERSILVRALLTMSDEEHDDDDD